MEERAKEEGSGMKNVCDYCRSPLLETDLGGKHCRRCGKVYPVDVKAQQELKDRVRAYKRAYYQRPEVKERERAYDLAYHQRLKVRERNLEEKKA